MSSSHQGVPNHGSALTAVLFVCSFVPRFFHQIHLTESLHEGNDLLNKALVAQR